MNDALELCHSILAEPTSGQTDGLDIATLSLVTRLAALIHHCGTEGHPINSRAILVASMLHVQLFQAFSPNWFRAALKVAVTDLTPVDVTSTAHAHERNVGSTDLEVERSSGCSHFAYVHYYTVYSASQELPFGTLRAVYHPDARRAGQLGWEYYLKARDFLLIGPHRVRPKRFAHRAVMIADYRALSELRGEPHPWSFPFHVWFKYACYVGH